MIGLEKNSFMKQFYLLLSLCFLATTLFAQGELDDEVRSFYRDESSLAFTLNTNGYAANYRFGKKKDGYRKRLYTIDLAMIKHPKEIKSPYTSSSMTTGRFIYGKQNLVFGLKGAIGQQREMFTKYDKGGIAIRFFYTYGPALALIKPIYYQIYESIGPGLPAELVKTKFDYNTHQPHEIVGTTSFLKGFGELSVSPGAFAKLGFSFEYSKQDQLIRAIETGAMVEGYFLDVPIMAAIDNPRVFVALWVSYRFGHLIKPSYLK